MREDGVAYYLGWAAFSGLATGEKGQLVALPEELGLRDWAAVRGLFDAAPTTSNKGLRPTYFILHRHLYLTQSPPIRHL